VLWTETRADAKGATGVERDADDGDVNTVQVLPYVG
jgi:hypothetical protein